LEDHRCTVLSMKCKYRHNNRVQGQEEQRPGKSRTLLSLTKGKTGTFQANMRGTETEHLADDGHQAPDARELSLTIFNGKKCEQTIKAQDRGFRGDAGSTGTSSKDLGQDERERYFSSTES